MLLFEEITKDFYHCTSTPIAVFNKNYEELYNINCPYKDDGINLKLYKEEKIYLKDRGYCSLTFFTRCEVPIIFLFGPINMESRQECCLEYLKEFLSLIAKDKFLKKRDEFSYSPLIMEAIKYIHKHYENDIDLDALTKKLNINKTYFCNLFKKETGVTFVNFLNNFRIEVAKRLLKTTNYSLLEIAMHCGFSNQSYFSTTFKRIVGEKPITYRNDF